MRKLKEKLYRFMQGRYGVDTLSKVLLWTYTGIALCFYVLSIFNVFKTAVLPYVLYYVVTNAMLVWIFYRMFSRNVAARSRENAKFCGFFKLRRNKFRDRKTHVYRKCRTCGAVLRLPKAKGKHFVVCPRCNKRFEVKG